MKDIKTFKIITGEEVIAEVLTQMGELVQIKNPITPLPDGKGNVTFIPWIFTLGGLDSGVVLDLNAKDIITSFTPLESIINVYNNMTSKIISPEKPKLII